MNRFKAAGYEGADPESEFRVWWKAEKKYHLTARQAGALPARAGVARFELFHFSPRYRGRAPELELEAREGYESVTTLR